MYYLFQLSIIYTLFLFIPGRELKGKAAVLEFSKASVYMALASNNVKDIDLILVKLKENNIPEKLAYEGALMMKKAGLLTKAKVKLTLFKSGRAKLETAIKNDEGNIEYYFLRLIIQENSPKVVKYKSDLKSDTELIRKAYKNLTTAVQQAVRDYSKKSTFLKLADF